MKTLEVTDEQYAYIQHLREVIADEVVGKYGFVRERDAVQFLIDNLDDDLEFDGEVDPTPAAEAAAAAATESDDNAITYDENADVSGDDPDGDAPADSTASGGAEGNGNGAAPSADDDADAADEADGDDGDGAASDDDMLDRMMNLLETHDDKWEESPAADYRYRVTLPDGSTEDVQTKDDVRAILFKNYR